LETWDGLLGRERRLHPILMLKNPRRENREGGIKLLNGKSGEKMKNYAGGVGAAPNNTRGENHTYKMVVIQQDKESTSD